MKKNTKKTNTRKMSRKGAAKKDTSGKSKESVVEPVNISRIGEKAFAPGLTIDGPSMVELIRSIQRAEGNFDCFRTANGYCDQWECSWRSLCLS